MYPRLRRFAAAVAPQEIDPDDLMQEAIVRLLAHGTGDVIHVEAYVRQIIVHSASNHRRRLGRLRLAVGRLSRFPKVCAAVSAMQLSVWLNRPGKHHHHLNQPQPTLVSYRQWTWTECRKERLAPASSDDDPRRLVTSTSARNRQARHSLDRSPFVATDRR